MGNPFQFHRELHITCCEEGMLGGWLGGTNDCDPPASSSMRSSSEELIVVSIGMRSSSTHILLAPYVSLGVGD